MNILNISTNIFYIYQSFKLFWLVVSIPLKDMKVRLDHHPQLLVKIKLMFQTTNQYLQIGSVCFRIHQITRFTRLQQ